MFPHVEEIGHRLLIAGTLGEPPAFFGALKRLTDFVA